MRRPSTSYQPASAAMCGNPRVGQEAQQLELRVHARLDPAERLHDQLVAEHDRGVGLLDADRAHVDGAGSAGAAPRSRPAEDELVLADLDSRLERIRCSSSRPAAGSASAS